MMALARTYDPAVGGIQSTLYDAYRDRLGRPSDIREYLPLLYGHATHAKRILELGVRDGNSTLALLAGAEVAGGHVWSADIADVAGDPVGMGPWRHCPLWTFTCGDSLDPGVLAAQPLEVDLLFVDTSHTYSQTIGELAAYMPRVVPGGVAMFHDTHVTVTRPGEPTAGAPRPVREALDDWCHTHGMTWDDMPGDYGMGVIHVA